MSSSSLIMANDILFKFRKNVSKMDKSIVMTYIGDNVNG